MEPIALEAYEKLAEAYAAQVDAKPHNAYIDRPATLSLLPDVKGKRVLDAGCGPGAYAEILLNRGADVVCVDVSPKMINLARERLGSRAEIHQADLSQPFAFFEDRSFDIVISPLALEYVEDLKCPFGEFYRVLRSPGLFVFSEGHPFSDYLLCKRLGQSEDYFATELVGCDWKGFGDTVYVPWYRRPLSQLVNPLVEVGFALDRILEPLPTEEFQEKAPEEYARHMREPTFIHIRARKI
jgi:SAM-dependent methyltransferase